MLQQLLGTNLLPIDQISNNPIAFLEALGFQDLRVRGSYVSGLPICHSNSDNYHGFCFYLNTRKWFCFTHGCHDKYGSDLVGLIAAVKKISRSQVWELLKSSSPVSTVSDPVRGTIRKLRQYIHPRSSCQELPREIVETILLHSKRVNYLESRGFESTTQKLFPTFLCKIYPLKNRIIFPLYQDKKIVGFSGRKIDNTNIKEPKWKHFNIHSSEFLFNWDMAIASGSKRVYITEGIIDAISLIEAGFPNTIALMGTSCSASNILRIIGRFDEVASCLDNDAAGKRGTAKLKARCMWNRTFFDLTPPEHKDYGDLTGEEIRVIFKERITKESKEEI